MQIKITLCYYFFIFQIIKGKVCVRKNEKQADLHAAQYK